MMYIPANVLGIKSTRISYKIRSANNTMFFFWGVRAIVGDRDTQLNGARRLRQLEALCVVCLTRKSLPFVDGTSIYIYIKFHIELLP